MAPINPKAPGSTPQGPKQALSAEELQNLHNAAETIAQAGDNLTENPLLQQEPGVSDAPLENADSMPAAPRFNGRDLAQKPSTSTRPDARSTFRQNPSETKGSHIPDVLGHVSPALKQLSAQQRTPLENARPQSSPDHPANLAEQPTRPLPEPATPQQYRGLAKDAVFKGPLRDSPLPQKLEQRAQQQEMTRQREVGRHAERSNFTRQELGQLAAQRHKFEKKDDFKAVWKHEAAKQKEERKQKVNALRQQTDRGEAKEEARALVKASATRNADAAKEQLAQKLKNSSSESIFEQVLQQVLDGEKAVPQLPESVKARFAAKSEAEWEEFFRNALNLNSAEIESEGQLEKLIEALYRGTYRRGADGKMMLVSDLAFQNGDGLEEFKFSRIALSDPELLNLLEKLKPGDVIDKSLMQRLGEEFAFIQLAHVVDQLAVSEEQKKAILREFRQQVSASSRDGLEKALRKNRRENNPDENIPSPPAAYAGDQFNKKERHPGPPKFFMYMIYGVIAIAVVLILFILFRQI